MHGHVDNRLHWQAPEAQNIEQFIRDRQGPGKQRIGR